MSRSPDPSDAAKRGFSPMRLLRKLLFGHLRLQRRDGALHLSLQERRMAPEATSVAPAPVPHDTAAIAALLRARLQVHPDARKALPHLRYLSHVLAHQGWAALRDIPGPALQKMLVQVDVLLPPDPLLVELETKLAAELRDREKARAEQTLPFGLGPSDYRPGDKLQVGEAALSDFMREAGQAPSAEPPEDDSRGTGAAFADTLPMAAAKAECASIGR